MEVSNADRVVFPEDGITKGEVVDYYWRVADLMLPHLARRALTVERYPRGIGAKGFMQKNAPDHLSEDLIERHPVPKEDGGITSYPVVLTGEAIASFANLGVITFHVPPTTVDDDDNCDWIIWDLDPPPGRVDLVRTAAIQLRQSLSAFDIETVVLASGSNGYHLRTQLEPRLPCHEAALIARGISALSVAAHPDSLTLAFRKKERGDRVFVDWLRNAPYSTSVAPWSLRARRGAPVASPISWAELETIDPDGIDFRSVTDRLERNPWDPVPALDLTNVAASVEEALDEAEIVLEPFDRFRS